MTSREALKDLEAAGYHHISDGWFYLETANLKNGIYKRIGTLKGYAAKAQSFILRLDRLMKIEFKTYRNYEDKYLFAHACDLSEFLRVYPDVETKIPNLFHAVQRIPIYEEEGSTLRVKHIEVCPICKKKLPKSIVGYMKLKYNAPSY